MLFFQMSFARLSPFDSIFTDTVGCSWPIINSLIETLILVSNNRFNYVIEIFFSTKRLERFPFECRSSCFLWKSRESVANRDFGVVFIKCLLYFGVKSGLPHRRTLLRGIDKARYFRDYRRRWQMPLCVAIWKDISILIFLYKYIYLYYFIDIFILYTYCIVYICTRVYICTHVLYIHTCV